MSQRSPPEASRSPRLQRAAPSPPLTPSSEVGRSSRRQGGGLDRVWKGLGGGGISVEACLVHQEPRQKEEASFAESPPARPLAWFLCVRRHHQCLRTVPPAGAPCGALLGARVRSWKRVAWAPGRTQQRALPASGGTGACIGPLASLASMPWACYPSPPLLRPRRCPHQGTASSTTWRSRRHTLWRAMGWSASPLWTLM
jgi:hypothetical protein